MRSGAATNGQVNANGTNSGMGPADAKNHEEFLQILEEHRRSCEKEGKFDEAERTRKKLKQLRLEQESRAYVSAQQ